MRQACRQAQGRAAAIQEGGERGEYDHIAIQPAVRFVSGVENQIHVERQRGEFSPWKTQSKPSAAHWNKGLTLKPRKRINTDYHITKGTVKEQYDLVPLKKVPVRVAKYDV